jgi:flagellar biosynthetic protein FliO
MMRVGRPAVRRVAALAFGALAALTAEAVQAQEPRLEGVGSGVGGFSAADWLNLGWRLVLVVGVIWGAVWVMRWYVQRTNGSATTAGRQVQIIETRALGPNRSLQLVRLGGRAVLLGVTPDRINSLLEIDDPEEVDRIAEAAASMHTRPRTVAGVFGVFGLIASVVTMPARLRERRRIAASASMSEGSAETAPARTRSPRADAAARRSEDASRASMPAPADLTPLAAQQLQARAGYGGTRAERIAELQRAIARARQESPR